MKKELLIYLVSEFFVKLMPLILIPYFSHTLGVVGFGELSIFRSYNAILIVLIGLGAGASVVRHYHKYGGRGVSYLIISSSTIMFLLGIITFILSILFQIDYLALASITAVLQSVFSLCLSEMQAKRNAKSFMLYQGGNVLFSTLLTVFSFSLLAPSVENRVFCLILALFLFILFIFPKKEVRKLTLKKMYLYSVYSLSYGLPLVLSSLSLVLKGNVDRLIIANNYDSISLGVISLAMQVSSILTIFYMVLNRAISPYVFKYYKQTNSFDNFFSSKVLVSIFILSFLPSLISFSLPEYWFDYLFGEGFIGLKLYTSLYLFSLSLQVFVIILSWKFLYFGKNRYISYCAVISSLMHMFLVFLLRHGELFFIPLVSFFSVLVHILLLVYFSRSLRSCSNEPNTNY